ncbi:uncharacterized protein LOC128863354 [Anastrepha ludens]|uniref:uncharacterized protein LOC128863354 n=1 Tax=Anastrepha ludens TaxID=28586 RepID=UPI0023AFBE5D|nr:uncharacterized protein LOC128863354 [Anastrepha ludens]
MAKTIDYDFNFPNITAVGKFKLSDLLDLRNILGLRSDFKAQGDFNIGFENLRLNGSFRYDLPIIFGSFRIHDLQMTLSLESVSFQLQGVINSKSITNRLNNLLEQQVLIQFNKYKSIISWLAAHTLETQVNRLLFGKKIWYLTRLAIMKSPDKDAAVPLEQ